MNDDKKLLGQWTKKELMALPNRPWGEESAYDTVLVLSTGRKHDSGWAMMAIIGVNDGTPVEIASACSDDIEWVCPEPVLYGPGNKYAMGQLRTDCVARTGAIQAWNRGYRFKVGSALSSITITMVKRMKEES